MGGKGRGKGKKRKKGVKEGKGEWEGGEGKGNFASWLFGDGRPWCERLRLAAYLLDHY